MVRQAKPCHGLMNPDIIKEKIRIEQHKFETVYLKNLWTVILGLGGFMVVLLQLLFSQSSRNDRLTLFIIMIFTAIAMLINLMYYLHGRDEYVTKIDKLFNQLEKYDRST